MEDQWDMLLLEEVVQIKNVVTKILLKRKKTKHWQY